MKKQLTLLLTLYVLSMTSCDDDVVYPVTNGVKPDPTAKKIAISSIRPKSGPAGSVVAIFGENFGATNSDNAVTFGGEYAEILDRQSAIIIVRVPMNLKEGDYEVKISSNGWTAQSAFPFEVSTEN